MVGGSHIKANWRNQSLVKLFIDLCLEEESKHRPVYYRWDNIGKIILEKKGLNYNQHQLKRKWRTLQKKYRAWINLVAKATDYGSNPTADHRNWSTERWDNYIKKHPDAKPFRYRGLEYEEEMKKLFDGTIPTNTAQSDTSNEELSHGSGGEELSSQAAKELSQMNSDSDSKCSPESSSNDASLPKDKRGKKRSSNNFNDRTDSDSKCSLHSSSNDASLPKDKRGKKRSSNDFNDQLERVLKTMKKTDGPTLEECNQVLDAMKLLEMDSTLYVAACSIFCESRAHREQWMMLSKKPEEVRKCWILMIAKKLGLL